MADKITLRLDLDDFAKIELTAEGTFKEQYGHIPGIVIQLSNALMDHLPVITDAAKEAGGSCEIKLTSRPVDKE